MALTIDNPRPLPPVSPARAGIHTIEAVENVRQMLLRNAGPRVADLHNHGVPVNGGLEIHAAASRRVAQRVGRQVLQRLLQPQRVAAHDLRAGRHVDRQRHAFLGGRSFMTRAHTAEQRLE